MSFYTQIVSGGGSENDAARTERKSGHQAPMFSIIVPAFNVSPFIAETLESIRSQSYRDFETILINDGSSDSEALKAEVEPFLGDLIFLEQENLGAAAARNRGILAASGKYIAFLDGDDIWQPEYLEKQLRFLEEGNHTMAYCDAYLFDENGIKYGTFMDRAPSTGPVTTSSLLNGSCNVITSGTVCLREAIIQAELFDPRAGRTEDFDMWFRLAKRGTKIDYQKMALLRYRVRSTGLTGNEIASAERSVDALEFVHEKYELIPEEMQAWATQHKRCKAQMLIEKGKAHLRQRRFDDARKCFVHANKIRRTRKLTFVIALMAVYPGVVLWLFELARSPRR